MKYYVIVQGEYSDKQIVGVTDNHEKAIKYSKLNSTYDNPCYIEEYGELKVYFDNKNTDFYYHISFKNNKVLPDDCYCFNGKPDKQIIEYGQYYSVNVKAKNQHDAIKKAGDILAKYQSLKAQYSIEIDKLTKIASELVNKK